MKNIVSTKLLAITLALLCGCSSSPYDNLRLPTLRSRIIGVVSASSNIVLNEKEEGREYAETASVTTTIDIEDIELLSSGNDYRLYWAASCERNVSFCELALENGTSVTYQVDFIDEDGKQAYPSFHRYYQVDYQKQAERTVPLSVYEQGAETDPWGNKEPDIPIPTPHDWSFAVTYRNTPIDAAPSYGETCLYRTMLVLDLELDTIWATCKGDFSNVTPRLTLTYTVRSIVWASGILHPVPIGQPGTWSLAPSRAQVMNNFILEKA